MLNLSEIMEKEQQRIMSLEECLCKGLLMPFNAANSGPRKIMHSTQTEHELIPYAAELALCQTGYETRFGEQSSKFVKAEQDYNVIAKISKFSYVPDQVYYLIVQSKKTGEFDVIERIPYSYITEDYGILHNNKSLDKLKPGSTIYTNDVIKKTIAYDDYNNRQDGVNLTCAFLATERTKEDGIEISDVAAKLLAAALIKKVVIIINDNDISLNVYGDNVLYKSIPDIGQETFNSILTSLRREKKEESLYNQSYYMLNKILMSDETYTVNGRVLDINLYCNNNKCFENYYNEQLKYYYDESMRFHRELVTVLDPIFNVGYKCSYDLEKMYERSKQIINNGLFIKERVFSNIILEVVLEEVSEVQVGDKLTNRYGGKGVVSRITPVELMPRLENGEYIHIIFNPAGPTARENVGQLFELSCNFISARLIDFISMGVDQREALKIYMDYLYMMCPKLGLEVKDYIDRIPQELLGRYLGSVLDQGIILSMKPISEAITIDDLNRIYHDLPINIEQYKVTVPQKDSNGNIRYIETRRPLVAGKQYILRLKQYAEEKFSTTSLTSTNIQNQPSRNQNKKQYRTPHSTTPIKFGPMETEDMLHVGALKVLNNLLLVSASPHARRLVEKLLVNDDPFDINVTPNEYSTNRGAEKANVYLFVSGVRIKFSKVPKQRNTPFIYTQQKKGGSPFTYTKKDENDITVPHRNTPFSPSRRKFLREGYSPFTYSKRKGEK